LKQRLHDLKQEGPDQLLRQFEKLQRKHLNVEVIASNLAYLKKRKTQMQSPLLQGQGCPIGSGLVESGNKLVVQARLKGAGMHWAEAHVNSMLALRNSLCSGRWQEDWPKIEARLRKQSGQRRTTVHQAHHPQPPTSLIARALQGDFGIPLPQPPAQEPKPPRRNPWRNFKHGKALYQRSTSPKK
jgi:hypothetical protein